MKRALLCFVSVLLLLGAISWAVAKGDAPPHAQPATSRRELRFDNSPPSDPNGVLSLVQVAQVETQLSQYIDQMKQQDIDNYIAYLVKVEEQQRLESFLDSIKPPPPPPPTPHSPTVVQPPMSGGTNWPSSLYPCGGDLPPCYVKMRESGGNYNAQNPSSSASGAWQFLDSTWAGYGGYSRAVYAPPEVQDAKARALWAGGAGCSHWSAC